MLHNFEDGSTGIQFKIDNVAEVGEFLDTTFFEFDGVRFMIPTPGAKPLVAEHGQWLVRCKDGVIAVWDNDMLYAEYSIETQKSIKKTRGKSGK